MIAFTDAGGVCWTRFPAAGGGTASLACACSGVTGVDDRVGTPPAAPPLEPARPEPCAFCLRICFVSWLTVLANKPRRISTTFTVPLSSCAGVRVLKSSFIEFSITQRIAMSKLAAFELRSFGARFSTNLFLTSVKSVGTWFARI